MCVVIQAAYQSLGGNFGDAARKGNGSLRILSRAPKVRCAVRIEVVLECDRPANSSCIFAVHHVAMLIRGLTAQMIRYLINF